jgi:hypothetical protein
MTDDKIREDIDLGVWALEQSVTNNEDLCV